MAEFTTGNVKMKEVNAAQTSSPPKRFWSENNNNNNNNNKSGLLIKSSRLEISEFRNYFTKI